MNIYILYTKNHNLKHVNKLFETLKIRLFEVLTTTKFKYIFIVIYSKFIIEGSTHKCAYHSFTGSHKKNWNILFYMISKKIHFNDKILQLKIKENYTCN